MLQNIKIFSCCLSYKQLLLQNISAFNIVSGGSFNISLTNHYVSLEQSGPGHYIDTSPHLYSHPEDRTTDHWIVQCQITDNCIMAAPFMVLNVLSTANGYFL